jgi:hypothetical protein
MFALILHERKVPPMFPDEAQHSGYELAFAFLERDSRLQPTKQPFKYEKGQY